MGIYTVTSSSGDGNNNYGLDDPSPGCELTIAGFSETGSTLNSSDTATVTASTDVSFDDGTKNILTLNAVTDAVILKGLSTTRYLIVSNVGSVAVSS